MRGKYRTEHRVNLSCYSNTYVFPLNRVGAIAKICHVEGTVKNQLVITYDFEMILFMFLRNEVVIWVQVLKATAASFQVVGIIKVIR